MKGEVRTKYSGIRVGPRCLPLYTRAMPAGGSADATQACNEFEEKLQLSKALLRSIAILGSISVFVSKIKCGACGCCTR